VTEGTEYDEPRTEHDAEEPKAQTEPVAKTVAPDAPTTSPEQSTEQHNELPDGQPTEQPAAPAQPSFEQSSLLDELPPSPDEPPSEPPTVTLEVEAAPVSGVAPLTEGGDTLEVVAEGAGTTPTAEETDEALAAEETDDVSAAIAAAGANLDEQPTLDDIAPGTVASEEEAVVEVYDGRRNSVSIWPFVVYDAIWAAFAGYLVWRFQTLPVSTALFDAAIYPYAVLGGVVLTLAGPIVILAVWIASWGKPGSTKGGLFISSLLRGSIATLLGVLMWWGALMVLDQLRLGRLL